MPDILEPDELIPEEDVLLAEKEELVAHTLVLGLDIAEIEVAGPDPARGIEEAVDEVLQGGEQEEHAALEKARLVPERDLKGYDGQLADQKPRDNEDFPVVL
jgi:hypothetical protein